MSKSGKLERVAKSVKGEKAALIGGGAVRNKFWIVKVKDVRDGRAVLEGENLPGSSGTEFTPILHSWEILPLPGELKQLEYGVYFQTGDEIRDASEIGVFSAIVEAPVVLKLSENDCETVNQ